jgi:DNA-binding CsgD family transcriptional regulator/tetratricopeptide (TPR) repeat protein
MNEQHAVEQQLYTQAKRLAGAPRRTVDFDEVMESMGEHGPVESARMAVKLAEASGHVPALVETLRRASIVLNRNNDAKRAVRSLDRAISLIDRRRPSSELAILLMMRSRIRARIQGVREFRSLAAVAQESSSIAEAAGDRPLMAEALCLASDALMFMGDNEISRCNLLRAGSIADEYGDRAIAAYASHGMGCVLMNMNRYDDALAHFEMSNDLASGVLGPEYRGIILDSTARCLAASGEYRSADSYFQRSVTMLDESGSIYYRDFATVGLGFNYIFCGEAEAGLAIIHPVIGRTRTKLGEYVLCSAYHAVAVGSLALNDLRSARDYANRLLRLASSISDMTSLVHAHRLLATIAERSASSFWAGMPPVGEADSSDHREVSAGAPSIDPQCLETNGTSPVKRDDDVAGYEVMLKRQSRELLMAGLQLARKNEVILQLRHKVEPFLQRDDDVGHLASDLNEVLGSALEEGDLEGSLGRQFHDMSSPFLKQLSTRHPELTVTELKICTLLRSNLSSKEIARTLNLSPHTVDTHRLQIRRKLGLSRKESLHTHLVSFD